MYSPVFEVFIVDAKIAFSQEKAYWMPRIRFAMDKRQHYVSEYLKHININYFINLQ